MYLADCVRDKLSKRKNRNKLKGYCVVFKMLACQKQEESVKPVSLKKNVDAK